MTLAPARPVPNVIGETRVGTTVADMPRDQKRTSEFTMPQAARITKLTVCVDGNSGGPPTTTSHMFGVIYQNNILLGVGDQVIVTSGDAMAWIDLPFVGGNPGGVNVAGGQVEFGFIVLGGEADVIRVAQIDPDPPYGGGRFYNNDFAGPSNPYGPFTPMSATMSIFGTITPDWVPLDSAPLAVTAKIGFIDAQRLLAGEVQDDPTFETDATWHGTRVDPNRGSFAVVLATGALADLVGERIIVTSKTHITRSVIVFVVAAVPSLDADLSIARRAFAELDLLSADSLAVHVAVVQ